MDQFEKAIREKYRFPSIKGELTVEHLFDLPLTSRNGFDLDSVAQDIDAELKDAGRESFVQPASTSARRKRLENMLAIVVYVIGVKQAEADKAKNAAKRAEQKRQLTEILHIRSQQDLMAKSPGELRAMLEAIDKDDETAPADSE